MIYLSEMLQDETREKLVVSDNKVRQLEAQILEEQMTSAYGKKVMICSLGQVK